MVAEVVAAMTTEAQVTIAACSALAATAFSGRRLVELVKTLRIVVEVAEG